MRQHPLAALLLLLGYYAAGRAGLALAYVHLSATAIWAPTGIALAALLVCGRSLWPVVLLGAFLVNATTSGAPLVSAAIAVGNTLEAVIGAALIERHANGVRAFETTRDTVRFAALAALGGTVVSATVGVTSLALAGMAGWQHYGEIWFTWWLGDAAGALIVAPVLLLWLTQPSLGWDRRQAAEALALLLALLLLFGIVFAGRTVLSTENYPLSFLALPVVAWAALRFRPREVASLSLLMSLLAMGGTLHGLGPFGRRPPNESLLLLQAFTAVVAVSGLILATTVAERVRLARTLRDKEAQEQSWLASIIESSDDAIVSKALDGTITSWNAAAEQLFGYSADEAIGRPITLIVPPHRQEEEEHILEQLRRGERVNHFDTVRRRKDGSLVEVALTISPVRDADGNIKGASKIARDISERRRLAYLQQRAIQLEAENRAALEISRSKSAFMSRMSHELRTPLNGVLGFAQLLLAGDAEPDTSKMRGYLQQILQSGRQLLGFIDALLDIAAAESNRLEFHPETLSLRSVVAEVAALFEPQAAEKQIALSHEVEPGLEEVRLDRVRLNQVLQCLLSNAVKFTPAHGRVSLRALPEGERALRIEVRDTGPGIAEAERPRLFVEFQDDPGAVTAGSGIGLALARKLVQAQGGEIGVDSEPGRGSVFHVVLPRIHGLAPAP